MATPPKSNTARWLPEEKELLDSLIRQRLELEKDPTTKCLNRDDTFEWISERFKLKGYQRSAKVLDRRYGGRLQFRALPKPYTLPSPLFKEANPAITSGSSQHQRASSFSSDDIPLSQHRRTLGIAQLK